MPIVSGDLSASGSATFTGVGATVLGGTWSASGAVTVSGVGVLILGGTCSAAGAASVAWIGSKILRGFFFTFPGATVLWDAEVDYSVATMTGSNAFAGVGEAVRTLILDDGYTYDPLAVVPFTGLLRWSPAPKVNNNAGSTGSTATFRVLGDTAPLIGQNVVFNFSDGFGELFRGTVQRVVQVFDGTPDHISWDVTATGYLWRLNGRCPLGCWENVSVTTIVQEITTNYAPGFNTTFVEANLPVVTIVFDGTKNFGDCLTTLANLVGAAYRIDGFDIHLFLTEASGAPDQLNNTTNTSLLFDPQITYEKDGSQIRNRATVFGGSTTVVEDAPPGATEVAIGNGDNFSTGGRAAAACQRFSFTGKQVTSTPVPRAPSAGTFRAEQYFDEFGVFFDGNIHTWTKYLIANIDAQGGESDVSTAVETTTYLPWVHPTDGDGGVASAVTGGSVPDSVLLEYKISLRTSNGETFFGAGHSSRQAITLSPGDNAVAFTAFTPLYADVRIIIAINWWRKKQADGLWYLVGSSLPGDPFTDTKSDAQLVQQAPLDVLGFGMNWLVTTGFQVKLTLDAAPDGTQARKVYRQIGNPYNQEYGPATLLTTIPGAEPIVYIDNAATPRADEVLFSTLVSLGQKPPGALPPIVRTLLVGCSGITKRIPAGTTLYIFAQADDLAAQATLAAAMGGDGVREAPTIIDSSLTTPAMAQARADAEIELFANPVETVTYSTRDNKSRPGKNIDIDLTTPPIVTNLKIQTSTIDLIRYHPGRAPRFAVVASSIKYTITDLMRRILKPSP